MRTTLQVLLGLALTLGVSTSAHAVGFNLTFANPGADCALQATLPTDCSNGIDVVNNGFLSWDIGDGNRLFVNAIADFGGNLADPTAWTRGAAIQDFPDLGGVAVLSSTDQVELGEGLLFRVNPTTVFEPIVSFTDNHGPIDPNATIHVVAFSGNTFQFADDYTVAQLEDGALIGGPGNIDGWLFANRNADGPTWYVSSMATIPEPGTAILLGMGLTGLAARRRKALA